MMFSKTGNSFTCNTREGPLVGMHLNPAMLEPDCQENLVDVLYPVALDAFKQTDSAAFRKDVTEHILGNQHLAVVYKDGKVIAFRMWEKYQQDNMSIVYLAGMCVLSQFQGIGLGQSLLHYVASNSHPPGQYGQSYMVLRTQNPAMQACFSRIANTGQVFSYGDHHIPQDVQNAAQLVADNIGDTCFCSNQLVSRGVYGSSLYGPSYELTDKSKKARFNSINQVAGDAAYSVWQR